MGARPRGRRVRAVVVTGAGEKAFCTGIDRSEVPAEGGAEFTFNPFTYEDPGKRLGPRSNECWKPVVVAINGMACGGGVLPARRGRHPHRRPSRPAVTEHATFFDPHVTYGMPAVFEPALMLQRMPFGEVAPHDRCSGTTSASAPPGPSRSGSSPRSSRPTWPPATGSPPRSRSQPAAAVQASLRSLWAARELDPAQMLDVGNTFLNLAMSEEALAEGQQVFASGQRIDPPRPVTLAATVREAAARFGPRTAFVDPDGSRVSYADLDMPGPTRSAAGLRRRRHRAR